MIFNLDTTIQFNIKDLSEFKINTSNNKIVIINSNNSINKVNPFKNKFKIKIIFFNN